MDGFDRFEACSAYALVRSFIVGWLLGFAELVALNYWFLLR